MRSWAERGLVCQGDRRTLEWARISIHSPWAAQNPAKSSRQPAHSPSAAHSHRPQHHTHPIHSWAHTAVATALPEPSWRYFAPGQCSIESERSKRGWAGPVSAVAAAAIDTPRFEPAVAIGTEIKLEYHHKSIAAWVVGCPNHIHWGYHRPRSLRTHHCWNSFSIFIFKIFYKIFWFWGHKVEMILSIV